jgi:hypothetical protein
MAAIPATVFDLRRVEEMHIVWFAFGIKPSSTSDEYFALILVKSVHFLSGFELFVVPTGSRLDSTGVLSLFEASHLNVFVNEI